MWTYAQTHTGNAYQRVKNQPAPTRAIFSTGLLSPLPGPLVRGTQLEAYSWEGQTGEGFLHLRAIFPSCIPSILSLADALRSHYFAFPAAFSNLTYRGSPLFSSLFPLSSDWVTITRDRSGDSSARSLSRPAAHSRHAKIQVSGSQEISTGP